MWTWPITAEAAEATLRVGIHVAAGDEAGIVAEGASGPCVVTPSRITCPTDGPVRFRWAGDPQFVISGDVVVAPEDVGVAWVLAAGGDAAPLAVDVVTPDAVIAAFSTVGRPVPKPTAAMLAALPALANHEDLDVRRAVVDVMRDWTWRSAVGPLRPDAPVPFPPGWLTSTSSDDDFRVRAGVADLCRDLRGEPAPGETERVLVALTSDSHPRVRQAALRALADATRSDLVRPGVAWREAIAAVPEPGQPGRVAAASLARLAPLVDPDEMDATYAVALVIEHHPDVAWRVWGAFKERVPFREDWSLKLLRDTNALNAGLVRYWSKTTPKPLAATIRAWEPGPKHSRRFALVRDAVSKSRDVDLRAAVAL